MPIGSYTHRLTHHPIHRAISRLFGTIDLHSHFRLPPILDYVSNHIDTRRERGRLRVLELGCGCGINLFELAERLPRLSGLGYDLNHDAIVSAKDTGARLFRDRLSFVEADARNAIPGGEFDVVLLIDFLEHVSDPQAIMRQVSEYVRVGGTVLISVPTPRYPRVFGRKFHIAVGHLVEGYNIADLSKLIPKDLTLVQYQYTTGLYASMLCAMYYRVLRKLPNSKLSLLLRLCLLPFTAVDVVNGPRLSCSLFAVFSRA